MSIKIQHILSSVVFQIIDNSLIYLWSNILVIGKIYKNMS